MCIRDRLRPVGRPRTADRLQERHPEPRNVPAEEIVLQHLFERGAGLRRRDRQRGAGQEGGRRKGRHEVSPHQVGRYAGRNSPQIRHDGKQHLPHEQYQIDHGAAHRPLAAGEVGRRTAYGDPSPGHEISRSLGLRLISSKDRAPRSRLPNRRGVYLYFAGFEDSSRTKNRSTASCCPGVRVSTVCFPRGVGVK